MVKKIGVAVDSTADFPEGFAEKFDLNIIPVHVIVDGADYLDGVTITNSEIINYMKMGCEMATRAPAPASYADHFEKLLNKYDYIISFHVSSELSDCYVSAKSALRLMSDKDMQRVKLVDTKNISIGQALYAFKSINVMKDTRSVANLETKLDELMESSLNSFTVDSLKWLKKSGRIGAAGAMLGNMLNIKPIISVQNAKLALIGKVRGKRAALDEMAKAAGKVQSRFGGNYDVWVGHCDAIEDAGYLKEKLASALNMDMQSISLVEAGASVAVKVGPGSCNWGMVRK